MGISGKLNLISQKHIKTLGGVSKNGKRLLFPLEKMKSIIPKPTKTHGTQFMSTYATNAKAAACQKHTIKMRALRVFLLRHTYAAKGKRKKQQVGDMEKPLATIP